MFDPGLRRGDDWRVALFFADEAGNGIDVSGRDWLVEVRRATRDIDPAFVFRSSGAAADEGTIDTSRSDEGYLDLAATLIQYGDLVPGLYSWKLVDISTAGTRYDVAGGTTLIGVPGASETSFVINWTNDQRLMIVGPPGSIIISRTIYVAPDGDDSFDGFTVARALATVTEALSRIRNNNGRANWTIQISEGIIDEAAALATDFVVVPGGLVIRGAAPTSTPVTITDRSGSEGNYTITGTVGSATGFAVGRLMTIEDTAGVTLHEMHQGAWRILSVSGLTITWKNTVFNQTPPASGVTGTAHAMLTNLRFTGTSGIVGGTLRIIDLAMIGNESSNETFGIFPTFAGNVTLQGRVAVNGFGSEGVRSNYASNLSALGITRGFSSNNGNNGWMARGACAMELSNCISSGNGFRQIGGGGDGFIGQLSAHFFCSACLSIGNFGAGFYGRNTGSMHVVAPSKSIGDEVGYRASFSGNLQAQECESYYSKRHGFWKDEGGTLLAAQSICDHAGETGYQSSGAGVMYVDNMTCSNATKNGVTAEDGCTVNCQSCVITNPGLNGISANRLATVRASGSNVGSHGVGNAAYSANDGGRIYAQSMAGNTACSPIIDRFGNNGSLITSGNVSQVFPFNINDFTEDTTPAATDFAVTWDVSALAWKKVQLTKIGAL